MSRSTANYTLAAVSAALIISAASFASAQNYGPNPGTPGFVPLVSGPVPEGTTGGLDVADTGASFGSGTSFSLGANTALTFGADTATLTITNSNALSGGLYYFLASFGNLDFLYESSFGRLIGVTSTVTDAAVVINLDFNVELNGDIDGSDDPTNLPDANPVDDPEPLPQDANPLS